MTADEFRKLLAYCRKDPAFEAYIQQVRRKVWRDLARKRQNDDLRPAKNAH